MQSSTPAILSTGYIDEAGNVSEASYTVSSTYDPLTLDYTIEYSAKMVTEEAMVNYNDFISGGVCF